MSLLTGINIDPAIFKVNTANGDGSTTAFNLSHTPVSQNALYVYLNGLKQIVTIDFTLSGLQVTFTVAPATGQKIEFNYIKR